MLTLAFNEDDGIDREVLRLEALEKIQKQQAEQKRRFDQRRRPPHQYTPGDLVLIYREPAATGEPRKLRPKFQGPYQVKTSLRNDRYLLCDIEGAERSQRKYHSVHSSEHMKLWCVPSNLTEETEDDFPDSEAEC
ncbi:hypothetical protein QE152_g24738 [Popillia japonica]|uniref:Polyprotein n=1 Tax=Popillia japonica TaxID=7064 RepID=A0AAW1K542_POPJA